jgi:uncharacterized protein YdcH (DUF465 family)
LRYIKSWLAVLIHNSTANPILTTVRHTMIENHSLINEFPEHKKVIHDLKTGNHHFARLFDEYHGLDKEIHRIEEGVENTSDEYVETLKKKRLHLKDELFSIIKGTGQVRFG